MVTFLLATLAAIATLAGPAGPEETVLVPHAEAGPAAAAEDEGGVAPRFGWVTQGGNLARTAIVDVPAPEGPLAVGWTATLPGSTDREPVVSSGVAYVECETGKGQRTLCAISVSDGRLIAKRQFKTDAPLGTCVTGGLVVVQSGARTLAALRLRGAAFIDVWSVDTGYQVYDFLAAGREVYVRHDGSLMRYDVGRKEPVWSEPGTWRARLAIRGNELYALSYTKAGECILRAVTRSTGAGMTSTSVGHHDGEIPPPGAPSYIAVFKEGVFVRHAMSVPMASGTQANASLVTRTTAGGGVTLATAGVVPTRDDAIARGTGWVLAFADSSSTGLISYDVRKRSAELLADAGAHPEWLDGLDRSTIARDVLMHPCGCYDLRSRLVRPLGPAAPARRLVPVRGGFLAVTRDGKLSKWQEPRAAGSQDVVPVAIGGGLGATARDARMLARDGTTHTGKMRAEADAIVVQAPPRPASSGTTPPSQPAGAPAEIRVLLREVLLVEDPSGKLLHAVAGDELLDALARISEDAATEALTKLLQEVFPTKDPAVLRRLLPLATVRGVAQSSIEQTEARLKELSRPERSPKSEPETLAKVDARVREIEQIAAGSLASRLESLPPDAPRVVLYDLLRARLRGAPRDPAATERVRKLLPAGISPPEPFDALDWIDVVEAADHIPLKIIIPPPPSKPDMTIFERIVGTHTVKWRRDVVGIQAGDLLVITPLKRPGAIARCLSLGSLVCGTLGGFFKDGTKQRDFRFPITVLLCESMDEYVRVSGGDPNRPGFLAYTAGHYSPGDEETRTFLPDDDEGDQKMMEIFAHEITHHWMDLRCPYFTDSERRSTVMTPGYWVVEGFASFIEERKFDLRSRTMAARESEHLMRIAGVAPKDRLPWPVLFSMSHAHFYQLSPAPNLEVVPLNRLGTTLLMSKMHLFYAQSAIASHYLFEAENGAYREKLMGYVAAYERGKTPTIEQAFGMTPAELGKRIDAWCAERTRR